MTAAARALVRDLGRDAYEAAAEEGSAGKTARSLRRAARALKASGTLRQALLHPKLTAARKLALLDVVAKLEGQAGAVLGSLIERRAVRLAADAARAFEARLAAGAATVAVRVWAAAPLARRDRAALEAVLGSALGRPVALEVTADRRLLGGLKVAVGERIIDGTLAGAFGRLEHALTGAS